MLGITREQFREVYKGLPILEDEDIFFREFETQHEFQTKFLTSKLWRLNNLYSITNKRGNLMRFKMNLAQHKVYAASIRHGRLIILKSRQQGISTLWLISFFDDALFNKYYTVGLMANNDENAEKLLDRVKLLWAELHPGIKKMFGLEIIKDNTKEISLSNMSNIYIRTSFRSGTLQRLHISELGDIAENNAKRAKEVMTGSVQAISPSNTVVIESTAKGRNRFYDLWHSAVNVDDAYRSEDDFLPIFLSWVDDPDCNNKIDQIASTEDQIYFDKKEKELGIKFTQTQKNFYIVKKRQLGLEDMRREYPIDPEEAFKSSRDGTFYAQLYEDFIVKNERHKGTLQSGHPLYDDNLELQIGMDIGMRDYTVMFWFQYHNGYWRFLDEYVDNGQDIAHYMNIIKNYPQPVHHIILPHDVAVREQGTGKTRLEVYEENGLHKYIYTKLEKEDLFGGIEAVRQAIKTMYIHPKCTYLKEVLTKHTKEWDEKRNIWKKNEAETPFIHGADALRYCVEGTRNVKTFSDQRETEYFDSYRRRSMGFEV